jgi:putative transposase
MEKSIYNIDENGLSYGRGYVYSLQYHIVWCTKYRRKVLTAGADEDCKQLLLDLAEEYGFRIPAMEVMPDHVHVLIDAKPQFYISDMVKIMKGTLARRLFLLHPEMKEKLWGGHLWNPSYCVVTVSDRSREQVEEYIRSQKEKAWGGKGRPPRDLERLQRYHREVPDADHAVSRNGDAGKQQLPEDHSDASS